jgi:galactose-1-phosphate uridylyltransferase
LGELSEAEIKLNAEKRKEDIERLTDKQKIIFRRLGEIDSETEKRNHYLRTLMKCKKGTPLTAEVIQTLIKRIEVYPGKRVKIYFAFSEKNFGNVKGGAKA